MNFEQLNGAFHDALRLGDHESAGQMLEAFLETAQGLDLGYVLSLKAGYIMLHQPQRSAEGLFLVDESLRLGEGCPDLQMRSAIRGLALCYTMGDVQRATRYEMLGNQLLRNHGHDPGLCLYPWAFYSNLAHVASLKYEHPQTYWHLVQATRLLLDASVDEAPNRHCLLFGFYLRIAEVCLEMGRTPEAEDAISNARRWVSDPSDDLVLRVFDARCLLSRNQIDECQVILRAVTAQAAASWHPLYWVTLQLAHSLAAKAKGDVRDFNYYVTRAHTTAAMHGLDHMLCRIQRVMRTPEKLEVAQ